MPARQQLQQEGDRSRVRVTGGAEPQTPHAIRCMAEGQGRGPIPQNITTYHASTASLELGAELTLR